MKKYFSLLLAMLLGSMATAVAQSTMCVNKTDGTKVIISIAEIEDIVFPDDNALQVDMPYQRYCLYLDQWVQLAATCSRDGEEVLATPAWESNDPAVATVDGDGKVTAVGPGECDIICRCEGGEARLTLTVFEDKQFDMEIYNLKNRSCSYRITPLDPSVRYYYNLRVQSGEYSVESMDQHGSEEQNIYHFAMDWWDFVASQYGGMTWQDYMNDYETVVGNVDETSEEAYSGGLNAGTMYNLYAFGLNTDGSLATPVQTLKFTTTTPQPVDMTFACNFDKVTSSDVRFTITPSNLDAPYFVNVQKAGSYVDWYIENDKVDDMISQLVSSFSPEMYPDCYNTGVAMHMGTDYLASLKSGTEYCVIVFGWDDGQTTPVAFFRFTTSR